MKFFKFFMGHFWLSEFSREKIQLFQLFQIFFFWGGGALTHFDSDMLT
jgi:hypothetical protein